MHPIRTLTVGILCVAARKPTPEAFEAYKNSLRQWPIRPDLIQLQSESIDDQLGPYKIRVTPLTHLVPGSTVTFSVNLTATSEVFTNNTLNVALPTSVGHVLTSRIPLSDSLEPGGIIEVSVSIRLADDVKAGAHKLTLTFESGEAKNLTLHVNSGESTIDIFGINDFHGRIGESTDDENALGLLLSGYLTEGIQGTKYIIASAGDDYGASPFASSVNNEQPSFDYLAKVNEQVKVVGNHEFDKGWKVLKGVVEHTLTIPTLGANIYDKASGQPALPRWKVFEPEKGIRVAFIGVVTADIPQLVVLDKVDMLEFKNAAKEANNALKDLLLSSEKDFNALILLAHVGSAMNQKEGDRTITIDEVLQANDEFADILNTLDDRFDVVLSGHTHKLYDYVQPLQNGKTRRVIQTGCYAARLAHLKLSFDTATSKLTDVSNEFIESKFNSAKQLEDWVDEYPVVHDVKELVDEILDESDEVGRRVVGAIDGDLTRDEGNLGESRLANAVADSMRWEANRSPETKAQIALMNPGGVRTDLPYAATDDGKVNFMQLFDIVPFGNDIMTVTMTGAAIKAVLEQQWNSQVTRVLGISGGRYRFDLKKAEGSRVSDLRVLKDGETNVYEKVAMDETYRVATNNFLAGGGDGFSAFLNRTSQVLTGKVDHEGLIEYFESKDVVSAFDAERGYDIDWINRTDDIVATVECTETTEKTLAISLSAETPLLCSKPLRLSYKGANQDQYTSLQGPSELDSTPWVFYAKHVELSDVEVNIFCAMFNSNPLPEGVSFTRTGGVCTFPDDPSADSAPPTLLLGLAAIAAAALALQ